ncbi:FAD:protein FMN transferase [Aliiruegeria lutimaris]|uniref:FAD:protein FMN transferase n=1 Tax=Aliiruegeria lutimaris TaxID=571298 RepID=A0A1G8IHS2_9RHOB|nr:FAD:protein FMN transferase [Aliiruegeria lutimaris]SDI18443.1 thiamine biosynthesis lipoprotein [Aliiruegeria lutimaris]
MLKMSTEFTRLALNGPTMGTRWSATLLAAPGIDPAPLRKALQQAVEEVDRQMSTWKPESDLMRLNRAPVGHWVPVPERLVTVLEAGLAIGIASGGAFDIGMGDAVSAWGFSAGQASPASICAALRAERRPAYELLEIELENARVRKHGPLTLDLCGIAKGYGVDRLAEIVRDFGIEHGLLSIDGELRALGGQLNGAPWAIAVERPDPDRRDAHSLLTLENAAVATSGDYRHWVELMGTRFSHTMDPVHGAPLQRGPASVTVVAPTCMMADAWATAMMVLGREAGDRLARRIGLSVLFLERAGDGLHVTPSGPAFAAHAPEPVPG